MEPTEGNASAKPAYSVVVPLYNKGPHIARAIHSVLDQTFPDFELIIVNDASTDTSMEEVAKFDDPRISVFHRPSPGPGPSPARNLGIKEAKADWIAFLDADDEWAPGLLSEFESMRKMFGGSAGCLFAGYRIFYGQQNIHQEHYSESHQSEGQQLMDFNAFLSAWIESKRSPLHSSCVAIKRNVITGVGGFPRRCLRGGDKDTWLRVMSVTKAAYSPIVGATYYADSVNMITKMVPITSRHCIYDTVQRLLQDVNDKKTSRLLKKLYNLEAYNYVKEASRYGKVRKEVFSGFHIGLDNDKFLLLFLLYVLPTTWTRVARELMRRAKRFISSA